MRNIFNMYISIELLLDRFVGLLSLRCASMGTLTNWPSNQQPQFLKSCQIGTLLFQLDAWTFLRGERAPRCIVRVFVLAFTIYTKGVRYNCCKSVAHSKDKMAANVGTISVYRPPVAMGHQDIYMNISAVRSENEESFEERRVVDYINAYRSTGKPPPPCPPEPVDSTQRSILGLPPLFEPYIESVPHPGGVPPTNSALLSAASTPIPTLSAADLPVAHAFRPMTIPEARDTYSQSIVFQPEFSAFSFEELRWHAYSKGHKFATVPPPPSIPAAPALHPPVPVVHLPPPVAHTQSNGTVVSDRLQSISSVPAYDRHSFEELRLAFMRSGRQLTSAEIVTQNALLKLT